jgi:hypothetical protein
MSHDNDSSGGDRSSRTSSCSSTSTSRSHSDMDNDDHMLHHDNIDDEGEDVFDTCTGIQPMHQLTATSSSSSSSSSSNAANVSSSSVHGWHLLRSLRRAQSVCVHD